MSRINSNVPSLVSQRQLRISQDALRRSLERLSSGLKINRGADNPAGLIVSERLRAEVSAVNQAVRNTERAVNVIATTEGALNEVAGLLTDIQALLIESANSGAFSDEEIKANQLQMDAAIDSITRIANTTNFAGRKLLNGQLDYVTSSVVASKLADVQILGARFGTRTFVPVTIDVSVSAQQAQLTYPLNGTLASGATVTIGGPDGFVTLSFPGSQTNTQLAAAISQNVDSTGVSAIALGTGGSAGLFLRTVEYGSDAFVSVKPLSGSAPFQVQDRGGAVDDRTNGRDAVATINGVQSTARGLKLATSNELLKVEVVLDEAFGNGTTVTNGARLGQSTFEVTEGGALFQLGPQVNPNLQENIAVKAMQADRLGNSIVGFLSDLKDGRSFAMNTGKFKQASDVVDEVITQVSVLRGRLGAFERNTLQPNVAQLQITAENLTSSQAVIRDTDFAEETSELTRAQILVQAGNSILAIANAQSQNVLALLGG